MMSIVGDHLWQSTLFALTIALLAWALRHQRAYVRHWLWVAASVKFLIPFALLVAIGDQIEWRQAQPAPMELAVAIDTVAQPFSQTGIAAAITNPRGPTGASSLQRLLTNGLIATWLAGSLSLFGLWCVRWQRMARVVRQASPLFEGHVVYAVRRVHPSLRIAGSESHFEPGVFGILNPVLVWPRTISDRLTHEQIDAIVAHEVAHVRRRDNLAAVLHMTVEALFWFHPLVWWISGRLVDERERACDEDVVRLGNAPHVYAEGILKTCQFYVESPLVCVAGVTGSNLRTRIEQIMSTGTHAPLSAPMKVLLRIALGAAVGLPVAIGVVTAPRLGAQIITPAADAPTFEVASVKPNNTPGRMGGRGMPGRVSMVGMPVRQLIRQAYDIHMSQIVGGPDWLATQGFDIDATSDRPPDQNRFMMQTLLRDRFKLVFHAEKREMATYALVVARSDGRLGSGLQRIPDDACPQPGQGARQGGRPPGPGPSPFDPNAKAACGSIIFGPGRLLAHGVPISMLVRSLANLPAITSFNRIVTDQTKLEGVYDFDFKWTNEFGPGGPPPGGGPPVAQSPGDEPALFTALQEQLGLKLNPQRETLDVMVIESVERPTEN